MKNFEVIVIGAGHAGIEASLACARLGVRTLMLTLDIKSIGRMSCNPAIGGVGKGQLVKDNCWIGQNAIILKGVTIGHDSIIGANSVVTHSVPPCSVVAGNPGRVINTLACI